MLGLSTEIEEAAAIDGAGPFRVLFGITLPMTVAPIATLALLTFINTWNDFFWPLLVSNGRSEFLESEVGMPIGVDTRATYVSSSFDVPDGARLIAFTDGLIERHDESLDQGLERLRAAGAEATGDLDEMMAMILEHVRAPQSVDDTAMTGVQWVTQNPS